jgi:hypothetical protein
MSVIGILFHQGPLWQAASAVAASYSRSSKAVFKRNLKIPFGAKGRSTQEGDTPHLGIKPLK